MKILMVFDFDHTVIDDNSDTWVFRCLPGQTLPDSIKNTYTKGCWTEFMGRVMNYIGEQEVGPDRVRSVMETIPLTAGMADLLSFILEHKGVVDCIVISDSNSMFIEWILQAAELRAAVDRIFTNPARINERGVMEVQHHHSHDCRQCPANLCKRKVLELYLSERRHAVGAEYQRIFYVGDGGNDLCPTSCLRGGDVAMPRRGYTLEKLLAKLCNRSNDQRLEAKVITWTTGDDVLQELKASLTASFTHSSV